MHRRERQTLRRYLEHRGVIITRDDKILCPASGHNERTPSCHIYDGDEGGHVHCHGCGYHADAYQYLTTLEGVSAKAALELLDGPNVTRDARPQRAIARPTAPPTVKECSLDALPSNETAAHDRRSAQLDHVPAALDGRGFTVHDLHLLRVAAENGRAILPITGPDGQVLRLKRRAAPDEVGYRYRYVDAHGTGAPAWCSPDLRDATTVLVIEGELNGMAAWRARPDLGVVGVAGTSGSIPLSALAGRHVIVYADGDKPGRAALARWAATLHDRGCSVCTLAPWEDGDACDVAARHGRDELAARLAADNATPFAGREGGDPGAATDEPPDDAAVGDADSEPWADPRPLPPVNPDPPRIDPDLIPEPLRAYLVDAAELASLPLDYYVPAALVGLSMLIGNRFRIQLKQHDDFTVVPNLWGCLVAHSGSMKSGASTVALAPLEDLQRELHAQHEQDRAANASRVDELEVIAGGLRERRKSAARSKKGIDRDSLHSLTAEIGDTERELEDLRAPRPTLRVNDPTVERLVELLRDNPHGIAVIRDELIGWLRNLSKQGREGDRAFYLEGWAGDQGHEQERIGRGDTNAPIVTLGVYGTIQPGALAPYQRGAMENGEDADGLLQRFQVLVFPGLLDPFKNVDRYPDYAARAEVQRLYRALYYLDPIAFAEEPPEGFVGFGGSIPGKDYGVLRFDEGAQHVFDDWRRHLENRLRFPTKTQASGSAYLSHLSKYRSLVPSLAGIFHLVNLANARTPAEVNPHNPRNPADLLITTDTLCRAIYFADYLEAHARRVYASELEATHNVARALLDRIKQGQVSDGVSLNDIVRKDWSNLDRPNLVAAIDELEARGWLRTETRSAGPKGGRPSRVVRLHPRLIDHLEGTE